jgi:uncharacterized phage-associated protein
MLLAEDVASKFLEFSMRDAKYITPLKLQKLMYFAYGAYAKLHDKPLFGEEFQAWRLGPVLRTIFHKFKFFGGENIKDYGHNGRIVNLKEHGFIFETQMDKETEELIENVWNQLKDVDAKTLSDWTHLNNSPWHQSYEENKNNPINFKEVKDYFTRILSA